jgi:NAD(P)-dependent dehydrogenase (short-subunit alcohol dehydrogenase family)
MALGQIDLDKQVALVSGANRGIGLATVEALARLVGFVVAGTRDKERGEEAISELTGTFRNVACLQLDVDDPISIRKCGNDVLSRFGRLDILVNNAGIYGDVGPLLVTPTQVIESSFRTHAVGSFELIKTCAPIMLRNGYGRIVNVSSGLGALTGMEGGAIGYRMSKAALNVLTLVAAHELRACGILVNAMCPGWVCTRLTEFKGTRTAAEATDTIVYLATLASDGPTGMFFRDRQPISW